MAEEEEATIAEGESSGKESEVAPALISVHPLEKYVVAAVGPVLRVFDLHGQRSITLSDYSGGPPHSDAIRAICFGAKGRLFASAGDDKLVKVWATDSWHCIRTVSTEKRVSAVAVSHDGRFVTHADKFGIVWIVELDKDDESPASVDKKAAPIFGHYCSIITGLEFSPDGRFIATADRDFKIRITMFPNQPLKGPHEIQSFCLGHTDFVSCIAFTCPPDCPQGLLLSGSGDSTVRLWDFISGCLLDTCEVGSKAGVVESSGSKEGYPAVTGICVSSDGSLVAVSIQSLNAVILLYCNPKARSLSIAKVFSMEDNYVPTSLGWSLSAEHLWTIMGASSYLPNLGNIQLTCVKVVSGFNRSISDSDGHDPVILQDNEVPGGEELLLTLQGSSDVVKEEATLAATAEALKAAMNNLLIKKHYSVENRELRKRTRNDRKQKL